MAEHILLIPDEINPNTGNNRYTDVAGGLAFISDNCTYSAISIMESGRNGRIHHKSFIQLTFHSNKAETISKAIKTIFSSFPGVDMRYISPSKEVSKCLAA